MHKLYPYKIVDVGRAFFPHIVMVVFFKVGFGKSVISTVGRNLIFFNTLPEEDFSRSFEMTS